jgi:hypothetical protein
VRGLQGASVFSFVMAHYVNKSAFDAAVTELTEQQRVSKDVARRFGWKPEAVRVLKRGVCFVTVRGSFISPVEFLFADGLLVRVPVKKWWEH